jgi:hypothetical protein
LDEVVIFAHAGWVEVADARSPLRIIGDKLACGKRVLSTVFRRKSIRKNYSSDNMERGSRTAIGSVPGWDFAPAKHSI